MATDNDMETATGSFGQLAAHSKDFAWQLLTVGENRLELLTVEVQEERERLLRAILLALGVAAFGLLAGITLTAGHRGLAVGLLTLVTSVPSYSIAASSSARETVAKLVAESLIA
jgi:hypothetical protein